MNQLPTRTLHDLALVAVYIAGAAADGARKTFERLKPHIRPPADLEVRSTNGSTYSGLLLLDDNEVIAGAHRSMNPRRRVQRQDMLDNEHAMVTPAYCDAFFTKDRNLYDLLAHRCSVPRRRGCRLIRDEHELLELLRSHDRRAQIG